MAGEIAGTKEQAYVEMNVKLHLNDEQSAKLLPLPLL
jgi:hypothetical protein